MGELRSVEGTTIVSEVPLVGANAMIEKSVWETQNTVRTIVAYIEWVYGTASDPGGVIST